MLRARTMISWPLLMAGCSLAAVVSLALAAQVPQKPTQLANEQQKSDQPVKAKPTKQATIVEELEQIISKKPVLTGPVDDELRDLLTARRDAAMRRLKVQQAFLQNGGVTLEKFTDAIYLVCDAQLELTDLPAQRVPILELRLGLAKDIENREVADEKIGRGTVTDVEEARYRRLGFEIDLLRARRNLAKK